MPRKFIAVFLLLFFVWSTITGFDTQEMVLGVIVSFLVSMVSSRELIKGSLAPKLHPKRWIFFVIFAVVFVIYEVWSHIEMAVEIILGRQNDGVYRFDSRFKEPVPLTVLGNSITLTPGTLTLDVDGNKVSAYCLSKKSEGMIKVFETFLEGIFS